MLGYCATIANQTGCPTTVFEASFQRFTLLTTKIWLFAQNCCGLGSSICCSYVALITATGFWEERKDNLVGHEAAHFLKVTRLMFNSSINYYQFLLCPAEASISLMPRGIPISSFTNNIKTPHSRAAMRRAKKAANPYRDNNTTCR